MGQQFGQLTVRHDAIGVPGEGEARIIENRDALFELVREDALGRYRPLSGAGTLQTGWDAPLSAAFSRENAIETVYPLAIVHQRQLAAGTLRVVSLDDVLARQSGRYEASGALSPEGRARAVRTVCGECVRRPVWDGATCGPDEIPCPEPCSVLVAFCREAVLWQQERPAPTEPDPTIPWAAFEEPGNELRERYLQEMDHHE
jgi:sirohydrochlorin cobaltochelatase